MKRPGEVALSAVCGFVAAALAAVLAIVGFIVLSRDAEGSAFFAAAWRWSPLFHVLRALLSAVVFAATSLFMLKGQRWARDLFVGWSWVQLILNVIAGPHFRSGWSAVSFAQIIVTLVLSYLLLTGSSKAYFVESEPA